jgi:hypothetical protein
VTPPRHRLPHEEADWDAIKRKYQRTPFSVILHGPDSPCLSDGYDHLRTDGYCLNH